MSTLRSSVLSPRRFWALSASGLASFFAVWYFFALSGLVPQQLLPTPVAIVKAFIKLTQQPFAGYTLQQHLISSIGRFFLGFGVAVAVGVPLGLMMGWFRRLDNAITPLFESVRFVSPIAWVPFAALWFGTGIGGPTLIIFAGAFPPALINAYRGARFVETRLIEAAQSLGASNWRIISEILLPASVPSIIAGLRISAGLGWQSLIGAELIVVSSGIGYMMVKGQSNIDTPVVMSCMIAIGMVGLIIDVLLRRLEAYINLMRGHAA